MTLKEIIELALRLLTEDVDDVTYAEYEPLLKSAVNDAYMDICKFKYVPIKTEQILLSNGSFNISILSETLHNIIEIKNDARDFMYRLEDGVCYVFPNINENVTVRYSYVPQELLLDTDTPIFPAEYHSCLSDYAVYRALGVGSQARQARALFFFDLYVNKANKIERYEHSETIKNKYA